MNTSMISRAGRAILVPGSSSVVGDGTAWEIERCAGGMFSAYGQNIPIESVEDDTHLTLSYPWTGPNVPAGGTYSIWRATSDAADIVEASARLAETVRMLQTGQFLNPTGYGSGTTAQRTRYDNEDEGFFYYRTDGAQAIEVCVHGVGAGVWSNYQPLQGSIGVTGRPGENGVDGIGNLYDPSINIPGFPPAGAEYFFIARTRVNFATNMANSVAKAIEDTATTADAVFSIRRNGVQFATLTFPVGDADGVFAGAAATFEIGDVGSVVAPSPRNATLRSVAITLAGTRLT